MRELREEGGRLLSKEGKETTRGELEKVEEDDGERKKSSSRSRTGTSS